MYIWIFLTLYAIKFQDLPTHKRLVVFCTKVLQGNKTLYQDLAWQLMSVEILQETP